MKLPAFLKKRKRLDAVARRAVPAAARDFDEPNMKLSSAVIVVLVLHLVAIGGIWAFSSIKAHRGAAFDAPEKTQKPEVANAGNEVAAAQKTSHSANAATEKAPDVSGKKSAAAPGKTNQPKDSGETYTVLKGDKVATIAKKLKVNPDDLMKLNKIPDPTKLQIGKALRVPAKHSSET